MEYQLSEGVLLFAIGGIFGLLVWGLKRMVAGQDKINETLMQIHKDIALTNARVSKVEIRFDDHIQHDGAQHQVFMDTMGKMVSTMAYLRRGVEE